mgnify:CR=1 FL=1
MKKIIKYIFTYNYLLSKKIKNKNIHVFYKITKILRSNRKEIDNINFFKKNILFLFVKVKFALNLTFFWKNNFFYINN